MLSCARPGVWCVFLTMWLSAAPAWSQQTAEIGGTVRDEQQAAIVGATVALRGSDDRPRTTQSDATGRFVFPALAPDVYRLTVEAPGFQVRDVGGIQVAAGRAVTRDVELSVATREEIVNVSATGFVERPRDQTATQSTVRKSTIALLGTAAQSNIWKPLELLPSLHVETADPYGLSSRQPWNLRIRGQAGIGTGYMVEGVPIWAVETPGPRVDMFDLENVDGITLFRGGVPPNQGLGGQDTAGALDVRFLRPADAFGVTVTQGTGSWGFARTFLRVDSGKLSSGSQFFASYSHTDADKWKGPGETPGYRQHGSFGLEQRIGSRVTAAAYVDVNQQELHAFRSLTSAQIQDLPTFSSLDYNATLTGNPTTDTNYFDFNRSKTRDVNVVGRVTARLAPRATLVVRPYVWTENQPVYSAQTIPGTTVPGIRQRMNDFDREGTVAELQTSALGAQIAAGYWFERFNLRIAEKYYTVGTTGDLLFNRWTLDQPSNRGVINSPYVTIGRNLGPLRIDTGVRYFHLANPGQTAYVTPTLGEMSYDDALRAGSPVDPGASFVGNTQAPWLPFAGASYTVNPAVTIYGNYGRNYARSQSYPELMQTYLSARPAYTAAGVDMQYLYDQFRLATSNNYELGLRLNYGSLFLAPSVFYADYRNKLLTVFDPIANRTIRQAVGRARTRGVELEAGITPIRQLAVFGSLSYDRSELLDNLFTAANAFLAVQGKQTPDTPHVLAKVGATYSIVGASVSPTVRFVDERYGDALNTQLVPSYTLTDLTVAYALNQLPGLNHSKSLNGLTVTLSAQNLFDRRYVAVIGAFEDAASGSYFVGPSRTIALRLGVAFGR